MGWEYRRVLVLVVAPCSCGQHQRVALLLRQFHDAVDGRAVSQSCVAGAVGIILRQQRRGPRGVGLVLLFYAKTEAVKRGKRSSQVLGLSPLILISRVHGPVEAGVYSRPHTQHAFMGHRDG